MVCTFLKRALRKERQPAFSRIGVVIFGDGGWYPAAVSIIRVGLKAVPFYFYSKEGITMPFEAKVTVITDDYKAAHGKEPRGIDDWVFNVGRNEIGYVCTYAKAKQYAMDYAKSHDIWAIKVKP
jgi:hypothetical protein